MNYFDQAAKMWDDNPVHFERSKAIATKIVEKKLLEGKNTALEFGAGTGILSVMLADKLKHITLMDSSVEMIKIISIKILDLHFHHLESLYFDLEKDELKNKKFDAIYTQMTMHHVVDIDSMLKKFYQLLNSSGILIIADLYPEDGTFHGSELKVHKGFDPNHFKEKLLTLKFSDIQYEQCFEIKRNNEWGQTKLFPVFILSAYKK